MEECIFCNIIQGELKKPESDRVFVYEDDAVVSFLDVNPRSPGHVMVIPKNHAETILDLPDTDIEKLFTGVKEVTRRISNAIHPDGFTIGINHGRIAGQAVDHVHVHIIPRYEGDGGLSIHGVVHMPSPEPLEVIRAKIRNA